jgi:hypothetical protein
MYLVHHTHILSTMLTAHDTLLTQMCDALNNLLRQLSSFLVSSPLDISTFSFALFVGISGPSGSHVLGKIVEVFANLVECMISLPKKPESFQNLLLDLHLVCSKQLIDSLHVIASAAMPVPIVFIFRNFLVILLLGFLCHVTTPDAT